MKPRPRLARLTIDPNTLCLGGRHLGFDAPCASAFSVLNGKVLVARRSTHAVIFAALKSACEGTGSLMDYGVKSYPTLTTRDLQNYAMIREKVATPTGIALGDLRRALHSGRVWKSVPIGGRNISVISFWVDRQDQWEQEVALVIQTYTLKGAVQAEWLDGLLEAPGSVYPYNLT